MKAFLYGVPIGALGGLTGLGGGEFRLPVLTRILGYNVKLVVPIYSMYHPGRGRDGRCVRGHRILVSLA